MAAEEGDEAGEPISDVVKWLPVLVAIGMTCLLGGVLILILAGLFSSGSATGGVVIFIGPFPIAFGAGTDAGLLVLIGIIIATVSATLTYMMWRRQRA